ncbi:hypothetical protein [Sphaerisporangium perillae]|uniref:hypothetical protein n=1 Tax=Sphaerisporangium perillae TaxID=2935860 RepID=UPI00200E7F43|nr:hypothetical protein [Sphaerisporangium perillae]
MKNTDEIDAMTRALARVQPGQPVGDPSDPEARTLLALITAEEPATAVGEPRRARHHGPRRLVLVAAAAVLATGIVVGPSLLGNGRGVATSYASSEIEIQREGDEYVARIKDPYADHQKYREAFKALGLDVDVRIVPVAPGKVGQEVTGFQDGVRKSGKEWTSPSGMEDRDGKPCMAQQKGCYLVLRVPADLTGKAYLRLGRQANPGEAYDEDGGTIATTKGGSLAGYRVDEKTVGEVVPEIEKRGLKVTYLIMTVGPGNPGGFGIDPDKQSVPVGKDWVVWEAEEAASDTVRLLVTDKRYDKNPVYGGPRDNVITD